MNRIAFHESGAQSNDDLTDLIWHDMNHIVHAKRSSLVSKSDMLLKDWLLGMKKSFESLDRKVIFRTRMYHMKYDFKGRIRD